MPVYAYKCRDCGTPLEAHQDFSDAPLTECPVCGGVLRKQYGSIGVTFNGSGFYRTDSRAGAPSGDGAKASGDGAKSSGDGATKTDSSSSSGSKSDGGSKPAATSSSAPSTSAS